jgi:hypothetical protein
MVTKRGMGISHYEHVPWCDCPKRTQHIHSIDCEWADEFLIHFKAKSVFTDSTKQELRVCCCSPELSHDEIMKLKLIYKDDDPSYGDIRVMNNLKRGTVKQMNPHYYGETQFKDCRIVG